MTFLVIILFSALFFALTIPAFDADFWWHLATGRWIWEHRALPLSDPFNVPALLPGGPAQTGYQLTQYWLAQAWLYATYLLAGLKGALLLRAGVFTAVFFLLYRLLRRAGAGLPLSALLLALAVQAIARELVYIEIRPQMWSSLLFPALLLVLENLREGRAWARPALPTLMLLWANLHAGYILGVLVILIVAAAAQLARHGERRTILAVAALAIALTGCNPTGYEALLSYPLRRLLATGAAAPTILEESSLFRYLSLPALLATRPGLTATLLLPLLTFWPRLKSAPRARWDLFAIYLLVLGLGITAQRYLVFLVLVSCWLAAFNIAALRERLAQSRRGAPAWARAALTAAVLCSLAASYAFAAARSSGLRPGSTYNHRSEGAADYLADNGVRGNLFNDYALGGYLAWRLSPRIKVFIYGRGASAELFKLYNDVLHQPSTIVALTAAGAPYFLYQKVFDENSIDAVLIPAGESRSGDYIPLALRLARDEAWALVHARPAALVFLRKTPALAPLAARALPKSEVFDNLIAVARSAARTSHGHSVRIWQRSLALAFYAKGQKEEALRQIDGYLQTASNDASALRLRQSIAGELKINTP